MTKGRLYGMILLACVVGYAWVGYTLYNQSQHATGVYGGCLFKAGTHIPCPSCGSTRSVVGFFQGHWFDAVYYNPMGLIIVAVITVVPLWILVDLLLKNNSFHRFYISAERTIAKRWVAYPLIFLVIVNWIWNVYKDV